MIGGRKRRTRRPGEVSALGLTGTQPAGEFPLLVHGRAQRFQVVVNVESGSSGHP